MAAAAILSPHKSFRLLSFTVEFFSYPNFHFCGIPMETPGNVPLQNSGLVLWRKLPQLFQQFFL